MLGGAAACGAGRSQTGNDGYDKELIWNACLKPLWWVPGFLFDQCIGNLGHRSNNVEKQVIACS